MKFLKFSFYFFLFDTFSFNSVFKKLLHFLQVQNLKTLMTSHLKTYANLASAFKLKLGTAFFSSVPVFHHKQICGFRGSPTRGRTKCGGLETERTSKNMAFMLCYFSTRWWFFIMHLCFMVQKGNQKAYKSEMRFSISF